MGALPRKGAGRCGDAGWFWRAQKQQTSIQRGSGVLFGAELCLQQRDLLRLLGPTGSNYSNRAATGGAEGGRLTECSRERTPRLPANHHHRHRQQQRPWSATATAEQRPERSLTPWLHHARDHLQPSLDHGLHALRVRVRLAVHAGVLEPAQLVAAAEHGEAAILHRAFAVM